MRLIFILLLSVSVKAQNVVKSYNGINFLLHTPSFSPEPLQPLIIFLHGIGERGSSDGSTIRTIERNSIPKITATSDITERVGGVNYNFYVIAPQLLSSYGTWPTLYVENMIKWAKANLNVDPNRIYLVGLSLGGGGVWTSIQKSTIASEIAAIIPMCGTAMLKSATNLVTYKIPAKVFHCADDDKVGVSSSDNAVKLLVAAGVTHEYIRYASGGHAGGWVYASEQIHKSYKLSNGKMYVQSPNIYEWLLRYTK
jgi:predicted peptidase